MTTFDYPTETYPGEIGPLFVGAEEIPILRRRGRLRWYRRPTTHSFRLEGRPVTDDPRLRRSQYPKLGPAHAVLLSLLWRKPAKIGALASEAGLGKAKVSHALVDLHRDGLVERAKGGNGSKWDLTDAGRKLVDENTPDDVRERLTSGTAG